MVELQFRLSQQQDLSASFIEVAPRRAVNELRALPGVRQVEGVRSVPVRFRSENRSLLTSIEGLPPGELRRPIDAQLRRIDLPEDGLVLNDYLAARLGVGVGDRVWVEVLEGRRAKLQLPVARLVREHVGLQAYMNLDALNRALGDGDVISGTLMTVDDGAEPA
ncbi:MAG: ABC transporter permease, partial [Comamonadaceae bacterium]|nr:ABC transporter permease [Comamonadaceae bacterium]